MVAGAEEALFDTSYGKKLPENTDAVVLLLDPKSPLPKVLKWSLQTDWDKAAKKVTTQAKTLGKRSREFMEKYFGSRAATEQNPPQRDVTHGGPTVTRKRRQWTTEFTNTCRA